MTTYRVSFDVPESKLTTVIGLLSKEVKNLVIRDTGTINGATPSAAKPVPQPSQPPPPQHRKSSSRNGVHGAMWNSTIQGVMDRHVHVGDMITMQDIQSILATNNYRPTSASSLVTNMVAAGLFERVGGGNLRCLKDPASVVVARG